MHQKMLIISVSLLLICGFTLKTEDFEIVIDRKLSSDNCTMGYLLTNKKIIAYTLELPWIDNKGDISCISSGTYSGILRYDKKDKWRIELTNVPNRTNVQIHVGNFTRDTKGCILVGTGANINDCEVQGSSTAYQKLKEAFYGNSNPISTPNKKIILVLK